MDKVVKGKFGEDLAADYLTNNGYIIIERNKIIYSNKKKWLEIDILATKDHKHYLFEVKYRKSDKFGSVYETIKPKKLNSISIYIEKSRVNYIPILLTITPKAKKYLINLVMMYN
jgi:Holliday junction resolvase-like predicted endonuclease